MTNKFYKCDVCNRSFSRKWNALRHNGLKHANLANISTNLVKTNRVSYKTQNIYYDYHTKFKILNMARSKATDDKLDRYFPDVFTLDLEDIKIMKIIDQLIKPVDKLEELLKPLDEHMRGIILLNSLDASLKTARSVKSMTETVALYQSMRGMRKIADYMEMFDNKTFDDTILVIKEKIKNSYIFNSQNN